MAAYTSLRIIVVDNDHDTTDSQAKLLKMAGHEVHVAYDGKEALRLSAAIKPHVILIDIAMPQMSGDQLAKEIRRGEECKDTLLIAVTGYADEAHRQTSLHAGFNHYLVKPINPRVLSMLLMRLQAEEGAADFLVPRASYPVRLDTGQTMLYPSFYSEELEAERTT